MDQLVKVNNGENGSAQSQEGAKDAPKRMLFRNPEDKLLGGVCGGMADFFGWDPSLVRLGWIALTLLTGGGGIVAYIALWILLPVGTMEDGQLRSAALPMNEQNLARAAFVLIGLGGLWLLSNVGILSWLWSLFGGILHLLFWPALLIGAGYLVLRYTGRGVKWDVDETTERVKSEVNGRMPSKDDVRSGLRSLRQNFPI